MELPGLRSIRRQRLLTQEELADHAGLTKASISRLERGATKARISTVRKLSAALNVPAAELTQSTWGMATPDARGDEE